MARRLLGPPRVAWRRLMLLTIRRERALNIRMAAEFVRMSGEAAAAVAKGSEPSLLAHESRLRSLLVAAYSEGMPVYGAPIVDAAGKAAKPKIVMPHKFERLVRDWIETVSLDKVKRIAGTTREQLRNVISDARAEGLGSSATALRIRTHTGGLIGKVRAATIARTETHSAANAAQLFAAESLEREGMTREWIAAQNERTREDHAEADGQVVGLEQPFEVGGEMLMYPGDAGGSPEQVINCRCATGFIVP